MLYLTRHTAHGDANPDKQRDATAYYTAEGNPPGRWTGRGAPLLGLAGPEVTEDQMQALFGHGEHPDSDAIITAYLEANVRAGMTGKQLEQVRDEAIRAAQLGRPFPDTSTTGSREPVREITSVPFGMIEFFSRRRNSRRTEPGSQTEEAEAETFASLLLERIQGTALAPTLTAEAVGGRHAAETASPALQRSPASIPACDNVVADRGFGC